MLHKIAAKTEPNDQAQPVSVPPSFGQLMKICLTKSRKSDA
ncbi:MAG: hypothetical protein AB8W32_05770 [Arsenophonus endosymbiont of Dermacentor nuttalli]